MTYEIGVTCGIAAGTAAMLLFTRRAPDIILAAGLIHIGAVPPRFTRSSSQGGKTGSRRSTFVWWRTDAKTWPAP